MIIENGVGSSYKMGINKSNEALVYAVTVTEEVDATKNGDAYNINTGIITLNNATETPVFYLKNNETRSLVMTAQIYGIGTSTGGTATEMVTSTVVKNPTAGTIVSGATDVDMNSNRNYGSSNVLDADVYKGATGLTMTGGTDHLLVYSPDFSRVFISVQEIIPQGKSIGIKITPPTSNTSLPLYVAATCYLESNARSL